jgi:hypothetical protein
MFPAACNADARKKDNPYPWVSIPGEAAARMQRIPQSTKPLDRIGHFTARVESFGAGVGFADGL